MKTPGFPPKVLVTSSTDTPDSAATRARVVPFQPRSANSRAATSATWSRRRSAAARRPLASYERRSGAFFSSTTRA